MSEKETSKIRHGISDTRPIKCSHCSSLAQSRSSLVACSCLHLMQAQSRTYVPSLVPADGSLIDVMYPCIMLFNFGCGGKDRHQVTDKK